MWKLQDTFLPIDHNMAITSIFILRKFNHYEFALWIKLNEHMFPAKKKIIKYSFFSWKEHVKTFKYNIYTLCEVRSMGVCMGVKQMRQKSKWAYTYPMHLVIKPDVTTSQFFIPKLASKDNTHFLALCMKLFFPTRIILLKSSHNFWYKEGKKKREKRQKT